MMLMISTTKMTMTMITIMIITIFLEFNLHVDTFPLFKEDNKIKNNTM